MLIVNCHTFCNLNFVLETSDLTTSTNVSYIHRQPKITDTTLQGEHVAYKTCFRAIVTNATHRVNQSENRIRSNDLFLSNCRAFLYAAWYWWIEWPCHLWRSFWSSKLQFDFALLEQWHKLKGHFSLYHWLKFRLLFTKLHFWSFTPVTTKLGMRSSTSLLNLESPGWMFLWLSSLSASASAMIGRTAIAVTHWLVTYLLL